MIAAPPPPAHGRRAGWNAMAPTHRTGWGGPRAFVRVGRLHGEKLPGGPTVPRVSGPSSSRFGVARGAYQLSQRCTHATTPSLPPLSNAHPAPHISRIPACAHAHLRPLINLLYPAPEEEEWLMPQAIESNRGRRGRWGAGGKSE